MRMKVNDIVFQEYQGIRRFGVAIEKEMKDGWAWWKVRWFSDELYERAMAELKRLRNKDLTRHEYRVDELKVVDPNRELTALCECISFVESQKQRKMRDERQQTNLL